MDFLFWNGCTLQGKKKNAKPLLTNGRILWYTCILREANMQKVCSQA